MPNGKAEAHGCAIIEDVHRESSETDYLGEAIDDVRDILEGISELAARRHVGLPKRRQVGSDKVKSVRELRDQIAEHVAGGGKAVQQEYRWCVLRSSLAIENPNAVDIQLPIRDRARGKSFRSHKETLQPTKAVLDGSHSGIGVCNEQEREGILMRAILRTQFGDPEVLVIREIPEPEPKEGYAVIEVKAFGLNHAELHMRKGQWAEIAEVSGIECVGIVKSCAGGEFAVGTKVAALMGGLGRTINGSYAEYTRAPVTNVASIESGLSWAELAAI